MDPAILKMLANMSGDVDKERNKLQQLQAEPIKRSFLENGQSSIDAFLSPNQGQRVALQGAGAAMLGSDPGHPAKGLSQGIIAGMDLNNQINTQNRAQKLQAQQQSVDNSGDSFNRAVDILGMMPKPTNPKMGQKYFIHPESKNVMGLTEMDGLLYNDDKQRVSAQQVTEMGYIPLTGSSAALTGEDVKPPTKPLNSKDLHTVTNMSATESAYNVLDGMLKGDGFDDFMAIIEGSLGFPSETGREWNTAKLTIVNGVGRLESGGQIRENETEKYIEMLIPTALDAASPKTIKRKIRNGKAAARIFNLIKLEKISADEGIEELNMILNSPIIDDATPAGGASPAGTTPGGATVTRG